MLLIPRDCFSEPRLLTLSPPNTLSSDPTHSNERMPLHNQEASGIDFPPWQETQSQKALLGPCGPSPSKANSSHNCLLQSKLLPLKRANVENHPARQACSSSTSEIQGGGQTGNAHVGEHIQCSGGVRKDGSAFGKAHFYQNYLNSDDV